MQDDKTPKFFNNVNDRVIDDLKVTIKSGSKIQIAAASFSIYAFQSLKDELSQVENLEFLFTGETFTKEVVPKESREFYIPRLKAERSLYGTSFEVKLRNELNQQAIAKECAEWIRQKVKFKSNVSLEHMNPFMTIRNGDDEFAYTPLNNFTTTDLGMDRGNNAYSTTTKLPSPMS